MYNPFFEVKKIEKKRTNINGYVVIIMNFFISYTIPIINLNIILNAEQKNYQN